MPSSTPARDHMQALLHPIVHRQRLHAALQNTVSASLLAASLAVIAGVVRFFLDSTVLPVSPLLLLPIPIIAALIGFCRQQPLNAAARVVDQHLALKDRALSALEFASISEPSVFQELQIQDALQRLGDLDARAVVPLKCPKQVRNVVILTVASVGLLLWPLSPRIVNAELPQHAGVEAAIEAIENELRDIAELAERVAEQEPKIKTLADELADQLKVMKVPGMQPREALETISEMQAKLAEKLQEFNPNVVDAQMKNLSEALSSAEPFKPSAAELQKGNYQRAAEELEKLDRPELDRKSARAAQEKLEQAAKSMDENGLKELSEAVKQLSEAIKQNDAAQLDEATKDLAQETREQGLRQQIGQKLQMKIGRLGEFKALAQSGDQEGNRNSMQKGKNQKSERSSQTFGQGDHGKLDGAKTELATTRQFQQLEGTLGEGDSDKETTTTTEQTPETAKRKHQAIFGKYQKMSEAVLETEPIPLGQRQMIRKYFELIRPESDE